jgi:MFS family permease
MSETESPYPARAVAWYATIVFAILYWVSVLDRFIISLLVGPMKRDLGLTDVQFGMLQGFGFSLTYGVIGLACGVLADRYNRRWVIFAGVSIWSIATAACGIAQNYWQLLLARIGVGGGEAALTPAATSMLADLFPRERLTSAMTVYSMGSIVGAGMAYIFGGAIVAMVSHADTFALPVIGEVRSWQAVFFIVGIPGALLSLIVFTIPEPVRRGLRTPAQQLHRSWASSYRALLKFMNSHRRFFICHYLGFAFAAVAVVGSGSWYAPHLARNFGWSPSQIGLGVGLMTGLSGLAGQMICGRAVDAMYRRGIRDAQLRWYIGCMVAAVPLGFVATRSADPWVFLGLMFFVLLGWSSLAPCALTALNLVTPNELRGTGVAFFSATSGLVGAGVGPVLIAAVSDHIFHNEKSIGLAVGTVIVVCCPIAAALLALGLRPMRVAMAEAERP